jgi:hypothetical protein
MNLESALTLFNALYRSNQVVDEVLAVGKGIRNARGLVYRRQGRVEDGDDILKQFGRCALKCSSISERSQNQLGKNSPRR